MSMDAVVKITQSGEAATRSLRALRQEVREAEREVAQLQRLIDKPLVSGVELGKDARDQARQQLEAQLSVALENLRTRTGALAAAERQAGADAGEGRGVDSALNIPSGGRGAQPARSSSGGRGFAAPSDPFGIGMAAAANQQTPGNDADPFTRMLDRHTQSIARANFATTAMGYSHQRLRTEWRDSSIRIAEVDRSIGALTARYESLKEAQQELDGVKDRDKLSQVGTELSDIQTMLPTMMRERATLADQAQALRNAALAHGGTVSVAGQLSLPSGGLGVQRAAGAFLGGMGIGGGSIGGTLASAALGTMSAEFALAAAIGMVVARTMQMESGAFAARVGALRQALPTSAMVGGDPEATIAEAVRAARENKLYSVPEYLSARRTLGRTGSLAGMPLLMNMATASGRDLPDVAGSQLAFAQLGARRNPLIMGNLMAAFAQSGGGASMAMLPYFEQAIMQAAQGLGSSFTRAPLEGVMGMVSAASRYPIPGVDADTHSAMAIAGQRVQGWGQVMGGMAQRQDVLGDIAYYAVRQLGSDPATLRDFQERYRLDLTDPLDIYRASKMGPALAAGGDSRVVRSISQRVQEAVPDREWRGLMMLNAANGDPELAAYLRDPEATDQLLRGAMGDGRGAAGAKRLKQMADRVRGGAAAEAMFREGVEPELPELSAEGAAKRGQWLRSTWTLLKQMGYSAESFTMERGGIAHVGEPGFLLAMGLHLGFERLSDSLKSSLHELLGQEVQRQEAGHQQGAHTP